MQSIDVDFEVFKQLTVLRETEHVTYNDVIRDLLGLNQANTVLTIEEEPSPDDWVSKGVRFPSETEFRANYKGKMYTGIVKDGMLVVNGKGYLSPSPAAVSITGSAADGWKFWECKFPGKASWQVIKSLRK
jgi:hypothetical protein